MTAAALPPSGVTVRAPAKVNLQLAVGPLREDGFHELATIFQAVGLYDDVTIEDAEEWSVTILGPYADRVPTDDTNLALRAAKLLAPAADDPAPLRITIDKRIPVAGGMAGGSADAAATLLACAHHWDLGLSREDLMEVAAELGSDVAFPLLAGTALGTGRGEQLVPVLARGTYHWVFAVNHVGLSTPAVFAELDRQRDARPLEVEIPDPPVAAPELMSALRSGEPVLVANALSNDLQQAAIALLPELAGILTAGEEGGALGAIVSGSGPTIAMLAESSDDALDLCVTLAASGLDVELRRAKGPVHGCQILPAHGHR